MPDAGPRAPGTPLALIVSPIRSWPLDQGNRTRIFAMGTLLKERGWTVHFLLSELEGTASAEERAVMARQWDLLHCLPYRHERRQRFAEAWGADDWYDPALDAELRGLGRLWAYDLCLVNYAWYSRAFEALPEEVVRVIDTHDAFGDRHKRLYASGTTPAWYFTRPAEEGVCLDRADFVVSIQEEEQAWFEALSAVPVTTVGHVTAATFLPPRRREGRLRAGYLASGNPSNRISIAALIRHWASDPFLAAEVELHVAGPICREIAQESHPFLVRHGFVADIDAFYEGVDFSVNPNIGGSGLKIKSVEALSYGRPLFATAEGMLGISPVHPPYVMPDVASMVARMSAELAADPGLGAATRWARGTYLGYRDRHIASFDRLLSGVLALRAERLAEREAPWHRSA